MKKRYLLSVLSQKPDVLPGLVGLIKAEEAEIEKEESLGQKTLAWPVNKVTEVNLDSVFFKLDSDRVGPLEKRLREDALYLRYLLTTWKADPNKKPGGRKTKKEKVDV